MELHKKSDGQKEEQSKSEDWNRKKWKKKSKFIISPDGGDLDIQTDNCIHVEGMASLHTSVDYAHLMLSQFIYYTWQFIQDVSARRWKEVLVTPLLRPQSFVLAGWWSPHSTQHPGIWMGKVSCLVQGWNSFYILHCNSVATAYILLLGSKRQDQFAQ